MAVEMMVTSDRRLVRRAWLVLTVAFVVFAALLTSSVTAAYIFHRSAMQPRDGKLDTRGEVLLQPRDETRFKQVRGGETVREGDRIKVQPGMDASLVFFDGSRLDLVEGSQVLIDELQSSRFVDAEKRIRIVQQQGWARLSVPPTQDYRVGLIGVRLDGLDIEAQSRPGQGVELSLQLRPLGDDGDAGPHEARVAVSAGAARVRSDSEELELAAGESASWAPGSRLAGPSGLAHEFIRNGAFSQLSVYQDEVRPDGWRTTADQGGDRGDLWGRTELTYREMDGRLVPVMNFERRLGATDNAVHGIQQEIDLPLSQFRSLRLVVTFQVLYHSLSGGGFKDSEYPIIVKLTYRDRQNRSIAWYRGFYTHNEARFPTPNGTRVPQGEWNTFSQDLLSLVDPREPQPVVLEAIDIYASGHDFESMVARVSIEGE